MSETYEGACLCGRLTFRLSGAPIMVNCCHCRDCQRLTGSAFAVNVVIESDRLTRTGPNWSARDETGAGEGDLAWRCAECGVLLFAEHPMFGHALMFVRAGTLDRGAELSPSAHFFTRSRYPWIAIPDGAVAFETLPGDGEAMELGAEARLRLQAASAGERT